MDHFGNVALFDLLKVVATFLKFYKENDKILGKKNFPKTMSCTIFTKPDFYIKKTTHTQTYIYMLHGFLVLALPKYP